MEQIMKLFELQSFNDEGLKMIERGTPSPCLGEVVIKVESASINFRDFMIAKGLYNPNLSLPLIPLSDGSGEVVAVGNDVKKFNIGDRVSSVFWQDWNADVTTRMMSTGCDAAGVLSEYAVLPEAAVLPIPEYMTYQEAATLPCAAVTAWTCIMAAKIKAGDNVLLLGTGGVSIFGLQIAKALGANVIITSSSDDKLARAAGLGADTTINYKDNPDWGKQAFEATGRGVNLVIEIGGGGTFNQSMEALTIGGHISIIGALSGVSTELNLLNMVFKNVHTHGITVGTREDHEAMNHFLAEHQIHPVVDKEISFDQGAEAIIGIASGNHFGKIVVNIHN
jgi:NADPH:quinone reductase-like Zn-dependent oxidoreductase